jgi:hypothetical protein
LVSVIFGQLLITRLLEKLSSQNLDRTRCLDADLGMVAADRKEFDFHVRPNVDCFPDAACKHKHV